MKKIISILFIFIIATPVLSIDFKNEEKASLSTHTVMAELGAVSWCPHCPPASEKMYNLSKSGKYNFYYVTLVYDKNPIAQDRGKWLNDVYIPMLYIDGGYKVVDDVSNFESEIANAEKRDVHNISISVSAEWAGNGKIKVDVYLKNNEARLYIGHLRAYITEINSRWNDEAGLPFHYAFLDFAINNYVFIPPNGDAKVTATWDGNHARKGQNFGDVQKGNIMVVASISYWIPFIKENPWEKPKPNKFIAQLTDNADGFKL